MAYLLDRYSFKFGFRIKELRLERKLFQEGFANLAGIDRIYLPGIEKGERNVSIIVIEKLANVLQVDLKDLF